jgi:hypothetical protein
MIEQEMVHTSVPLLKFDNQGDVAIIQPSKTFYFHLNIHSMISDLYLRRK